MSDEQQDFTDPSGTDEQDGPAGELDAPMVGDDVRVGPETSDEPEAGAAEPTD